MRPTFILLAAGATLAAASAATARDEKARAPAFQRAVDCLAVAERDARLACLEREVAALDTAEKAKDIAIVDREQVREAKRSLFGLRLPSFKLLGGDDADEVKELVTTITASNRTGDGRVAFTVEDGARWEQTDDRTVVGSVFRAGRKVTLKRGALTTYFADFGPVSVKVKRVN